MNVPNAIAQVFGVLALLRTKTPFKDMSFDAVMTLRHERDASENRLHHPAEPGCAVKKDYMDVVVHDDVSGQSRATGRDSINDEPINLGLQLAREEEVMTLSPRDDVKRGTGLVWTEGAPHNGLNFAGGTGRFDSAMYHH